MKREYIKQGASRCEVQRHRHVRGSDSPPPSGGPLAPVSRCLVVALFAGLLAISALAGPAQGATRAKLGEIPATGAAGAGALKQPREIAVNRTGAGGVASGEVYVLDGNNRVSQFVQSGAIVRHFGYDVVEKGADNTGASETQKLTIKASGGKFALTFGSTTGAEGNASWAAGSTTATLTSTRAGTFVVGQVITGTGLASSPVTTITGVSGTTLTLSQPTLSAQTNRGIIGHNLPYNATAGEVESSLNSLPAIGGVGGSVSVSRVENSSTEFEYTISFGGSFSGNDPAQLTATTAGLEGSKSATVQTTVPGGGYEICQPTSSPTDVCKAGSEVAVAGGLAGAQGIAVDQTAGNVFVYETTNRRVEVFSAKGSFEGAFGWKVKAGAEAAAALQFCTPAGTGCQAGEATASAGGFAASGVGSPRNLAIDETGNLYVPDAGNLRVDVFSPTLNGLKEVTGVSFVRAIGWKVNATTPAEELQECTAVSGCLKGTAGAGAGQFRAESPTSVAVDSSGAIYAVSSSGSECTASAPCRIQKFNANGTIANANFGPPAGECKSTRTGPEAPAGAFTNGSTGRGVLAVTVDPITGNLFALQRLLGSEVKICELNGSTGEVVSVFPPGALTMSTGAEAGIAVGTGERVLAVNQSPVFILGPVPPPSVEILPADQVTQTSARLNGKVTIPSPGGEGFNTSYHFEVSADGGFGWTKVPISDVGIGNGKAGGESSTCPVPQALVCNVSQTATGLQPNKNYLVRLVATTGPSATSTDAQFKTFPAPPTVTEDRAVAAVTSTSGKISGTVNPNNSPTTYRFEYGTTTSYGSQSPTEFEPFLGSDGDPIPVAGSLSGLKPAATYHWRIVAINAFGKTVGDDQQFTTYDDPEVVEYPDLPDNRNIELVTPPDKRPVGVVTPFLNSQLGFQVSEDGEGIGYPVLNGVDGTTSGGETFYFGARQVAAWASSEVSPPSLVSSAGEDTAASRVRYMSPEDLKCGVVESLQPLSADTPVVDIANGVTNLYRWSAASGAYTLITNKIPLNPAAFESNSYYEVGGASADCSRIVFRSKAYSFISGAGGVYEWDNGDLHAVAPLPSEQLQYRKNTVSPKGRFFFTATSSEPGDTGQLAVFVRKSSSETVDASLPVPGQAATKGASYEIASPDGSQVFFLANYGIASTSSKGPSESCAQRYEHGFASSDGEWATTACDLYDYNVDTGQLTDISVDANAADTKGAVVQGVMDVSQDGSVVYFAALGQLVPGKGRTYAQNQEGKRYANVYRYQSGASLTYVGSVASTDFERSATSEGAKSGALAHNPNNWTSQTNRDGSYFLFVSHDNMTGANPAEVEQAYLYSRDTGATSCVSCPRDDSAPHAAGSGVIATAYVFKPSAAAFAPSSLSDDGRVVFTVEDVLTPGAIEGQGAGAAEGGKLENNIYEWHQGQVSLLATGQVRALGMGGPNGRDVFLQTTLRLAPQDFDFGYDVYDLRSEGGFPVPPEPPAPCDPAADQCQGTASSGPEAPSSATGVAAPGNPAQSPQPRPRCRKGFIRKKGHCVKQHRRRRHSAARANANNGGAK